MDIYCYLCSAIRSNLCIQNLFEGKGELEDGLSRLVHQDNGKYEHNLLKELKGLCRRSYY